MEERHPAALGLPDLMTPDAARSAVAAWLADQIAHDELPAESAVAMASSIYEKTVELGGAGKLDDCLVSDARTAGAVREFLEVGQGESEHRVVLEVGMIGLSETTTDRAEAATGHLLELVRQYVEKHPEVP